MTTIEKVREYLDFYCELIDFDIEALKTATSRKLRMGLMDYEDVLVKVYNFVNTNRPNHAIVWLNSISTGIFDLYKDSLSQESFMESMDELNKVAKIGKEIKAAYEDWLKNDFATYLAVYNNGDMFKPGELDPSKLDPMLMLETEDVLEESKLLKILKYGDGTMDAGLGKKLSFNSNLIISSSLHEWLGHLKSNAKNDDVTYVSTLMKIEARVDLTFFIIAIQYKDNLWLCTDMVEFTTPNNKASTRNPRRHRETHYDKLGFPYGLIDELDTIREKCTDLKLLNAPDLEFHVYPMSNLDPVTRVYFLNVSTAVIRSIVAGHASVRTMMTMKDYVEQKLLTGFSFDPVKDVKDDDFEKGWEEANKNYVEDLLKHSGKKENPSTELIKVGAEILTKNSLYDKDWLATSDQFGAIVKWAALSKKQHQIQRTLEFTKDEKDTDFDKLDLIINKPENRERVLKYLYSAKKEVYYRLVDVWGKSKGSGFSNEKIEEETTDFCSNENYGNGWSRRFRLGLPQQEAFKRQREWMEIKHNQRRGERIVGHDDYVYNKPPCKSCNKVSARVTKHVRIRHFSQLMFLAGITDRMKLPRYFRNYRAHNYVPYHGNSIINNVHPLSMLKDSASEQYPNGMHLEVLICKNCEKRLVKDNCIGDNSLILPDGSVTGFDPDKEKEKISHHSIRL